MDRKIGTLAEQYRLLLEKGSVILPTQQGGGEGDKIRIGISDSSKGIV